MEYAITHWTIWCAEHPHRANCSGWGHSRSTAAGRSHTSAGAPFVPLLNLNFIVPEVGIVNPFERAIQTFGGKPPAPTTTTKPDEGEETDR
jgi:hypothetical protein